MAAEVEVEMVAEVAAAEMAVAAAGVCFLCFSVSLTAFSMHDASPLQTQCTPDITFDRFLI